MKISATIRHQHRDQQINVSTNGKEQSLNIQAKTEGKGSSVNGGELLLLALATCYCNDVYREAAKMDMTIDAVSVEVDGEFGGAGEPAKQISYKVMVEAPYPEEQVMKLIREVDRVAEIHNTLRQGIPVTLAGAQAH